MIYRGYTGALEIDEEAGELFGQVLGIQDIVTFVGKTVAEAERSLGESVEIDLDLCKEQGKEPNKPFSGQFPVRVSPAAHRRLAEIAHARKISLNEATVEAIERYIAASDPREGAIEGDMGDVDDSSHAHGAVPAPVTAS